MNGLGFGVRSFVCASLASLVVGCALASKGEALKPRYFSPEHAGASGAVPAALELELRLGQVSSASHLDERISYRLSSSEVGFYDDRRWTEIPEAYLRRALERELFERRGLQRVVTGLAPTLDIELIAFEELRGKPTRARVTLAFSLRDERRSLLERSVMLERVVAAQDGADSAQRLATALSATLAEAVAAVGEQTVTRLRTLKTLEQPTGATPAAGREQP